MDETIAHLVKPRHLFLRKDVLGRESRVPAEPGIYAWYFKTTPSPEIDWNRCNESNGLRLLYVGISPSEAKTHGGKASKNNLRKRIRGHMNGNASGSTLRLSLGCLLSPTLGIQLRRNGKTERMHFSEGEDLLSEWLDQNASVCWVQHEAPWVIERAAVGQLYLPLNLSMNKLHPFYHTLSQARRSARQKARELPVYCKKLKATDR